MSINRVTTEKKKDESLCGARSRPRVTRFARVRNVGEGGGLAGLIYVRQGTSNRTVIWIGSVLIAVVVVLHRSLVPTTTY